MDELDRILGSEPPIEPSSGLVDVVMREVRREAAVPAPIGFPWLRFLVGFVPCVAVLIVLAARAARGLATAGDAGATRIDPDLWQNWLEAGSATGWLLPALLISYASYAIAMRLVGR